MSVRIFDYTQFFFDRHVHLEDYIVLVYYYTGICDVTVTKWNFKIGLVLPFKNAGQEKTECTLKWERLKK